MLKMLQFNTAIYTISTRFTSRLLWRLNASLSTNAAAVASESVNNNLKIDHQLTEVARNVTMNNAQRVQFGELKNKLCSSLTLEPLAVSKIQAARNLHDLLAVMKTPLLPQNDIAKAIEQITAWTNKTSMRSASIAEDNKNSVENQKEVENIQAKGHSEYDISRCHDLSTMEMIKEISKFSHEGNRNVQALNYMFQNIVEYNEELQPGACSSLMYSMSNLCYSDERLLKKICHDLIKHMSNTNKPIPDITIISIVRSMSGVRYKNNVFLDRVCQNIIKSPVKYNIKKIANILQSLASLGYESVHVNEILEIYKPELTMAELGYTHWLNFVWSMILLKKAEVWHIASVLNNHFVQKIMFLEMRRPLPYQLKLLNINGYALHALQNYTGSYLSQSIVPLTVCKRSKQKELFVETLKVTLKNMLPSTDYYKMNIDTEMGFLLDAELCMDADSNPVPLNGTTKAGTNKIGIIVLDYYDMCLGDTDYQGLIKLYAYLLTLQKYKVLCVPYQHFGIEDKIEKRVSYLRRQLWNKFKQRS